MDEYEVTNSQYQRFVDETGYPPPPHWKDGRYPVGQGDFPVVNVSYEDAKAYALWAGKRLPTAAEWERAAFGSVDEGRNEWPWGKTWNGLKANFVTSKGINLRSVFAFPNDASPDEMVATIKGSDVFSGELSAILGTPRTATVKALTRSKITFYSGGIQTIIENLPIVAEKLLITLAKRLAQTTEEM
ncbi:SUMF1/EgtB/PvdO family nonheme iron enzyme [Candidatus Poribacteria bacterium]|nr:SUMF1/EgtB/PvdO family nonheme iron enzyme [Candidatus Poribacteria bacterium]